MASSFFSWFDFRCQVSQPYINVCGQEVGIYNRILNLLLVHILFSSILKAAEDLPNLYLVSWSVAPWLLMELPRYVMSSTISITFRPMTTPEAVWWSPTRIILDFLLLTDRPSFPAASLMASAISWRYYRTTLQIIREFNV